MGDEMTIDEAIYCMKSYVPEYGGYELCDGCKYYASKKISKNGFVCSSGEARKIAIKALERLRNNEQQCNTNEMDINDVIHCMYSYLDEDTKETCRNCRYYSFMTSDGEMSYCKSAEAHKMAVETLEKLKEYMA